MMVSFLKSSQGLASQRRHGRDDTKTICRSGSDRPMSSKRMLWSPRKMLAALAIFFVVAKGTVQEFSPADVERILQNVAQDSVCPNPSPRCRTGSPFDHDISRYFYGSWKSDMSNAVARIHHENGRAKASFTLSFGGPGERHVPLTVHGNPFRIFAFQNATRDGIVVTPIMFLEQRDEWWILMPFTDPSDPSQKPKLAWYSTANVDKRFFVYSKSDTSRSRRSRGHQRSRAIQRKETDVQKLFREKITAAAAKGVVKDHKFDEPPQIVGAGISENGSDNGSNGTSQGCDPEEVKQFDVTQYFTASANGTWIVMPGKLEAVRHKNVPTARRRRTCKSAGPDAFLAELVNEKVPYRDDIVTVPEGHYVPVDMWRHRQGYKRTMKDYTISIEMKN